MNYQMFEDSKLSAPLQAGDQVGSVMVTFEGNDYEVPLVAADDLEQTVYLYSNREQLQTGERLLFFGGSLYIYMT